MAWSVTALALAVFFFATFAYRRREPEFLLFGLGCAALATHAFGMACEHIAPSPGAWHVFAICGLLTDASSAVLSLRGKVPQADGA